METSQAQTETYAPHAESAGQGEAINIWNLPKMLWASGVLFGVNCLVVAGLYVTPQLQVDMYGGSAEEPLALSAKPSPFVDLPAEVKREARAAPKVQPVVEVASDTAQYSLDLPIRTSTAREGATIRHAAYNAQPNYVSGDAVYKVVEAAGSYPKLSASVMPKRSVPLAPAASDPAPRKATEPARQVVLN